MIRFAYLRDELFLGASGAYALNRWCLKPLLSWPFLHNHFNDLLTIPAALPVVLWIQRMFRLRGSDAPPCASEIILHLIIWTILCEYVGPFWLARGVSDPLDVLAYTLGGWVAWIGWNRIPLKSLSEDQEGGLFPRKPSGWWFFWTAAGVGSARTAQPGDASASPPGPPPESRAAGPLLVWVQAPSQDRRFHEF